MCFENRTKAAMTKWLLRSIECDRLLPFVCIRKNPVCLMNDGDLLSTAHSPWPICRSSKTERNTFLNRDMYMIIYLYMI